VKLTNICTTTIVSTSCTQSSVRKRKLPAEENFTTATKKQKCGAQLADEQQPTTLPAISQLLRLLPHQPQLHKFYSSYVWRCPITWCQRTYFHVSELRKHSTENHPECLLEFPSKLKPDQNRKISTTADLKEPSHLSPFFKVETNQDTTNEADCKIPIKSYENSTRKCCTGGTILLRNISENK